MLEKNDCNERTLNLFYSSLGSRYEELIQIAELPNRHHHSHLSKARWNDEARIDVQQ